MGRCITSRLIEEKQGGGVACRGGNGFAVVCVETSFDSACSQYVFHRQCTLCGLLCHLNRL